MTIIRCIDVETLGLTADDGVCEIGWCDVVFDETKNPHVGVPCCMYVNPGKPIPPTASAVHHIIDADVAGAPSFDDAIRSPLNGDDIVLCAHNAKFEKQFIKTDLKWICSYKIAVALAPNAPAHNLQTLRYFLKLDVDSEAASPPHRAGPDAYVTAHLIARALAKMSVVQMVHVSSEPMLLPKLRFGKYAGVPCEQIPADYWRWVKENVKDDEDVQHTARCYFDAHQKAQRNRSPV